MARPIENTERLSVFLTKEAFEFLKNKAKETGFPMSSYVRSLILSDMRKSAEVRV